MSEALDWLIVRLEAPLLSFGGVAIDHVGVTRDFPAASMLTGLLSNALGWERTDWSAHQRLQDRLVFAARRDRENVLGLLLDMQNARLNKNDAGWTTWGEPEGRDGASFDAPHRRQRYYHTDACVTVALRLNETAVEPTLQSLAMALQAPARPLFVGRKSCLPSAPLFYGMTKAQTAYEALEKTPRAEESEKTMRALWPENEGPEHGSLIDRILSLPDLRNWKTGLHSGSRLVVEGRIVFGEAAQ